MTSSQQIRELWQIKSYCANDGALCEAAERLWHWLALREDDPIAQYLTGKSEVMPEPPALHEIERAIMVHYQPHRDAIVYLRAFAIVINRGNETGIFDLCPPRIPILSIPEKSPFLEEKVLFLPLARRWRDCVLNTTVKNREGYEKPFIGQILASAILNGGLQNRLGLAALLKQIYEPLECIRHKSRCGKIVNYSFLDLKLSIASLPKPVLRRWFPDHFSEALLLRVDGHIANELSTKNALPPLTVWAHIKKFFEHADFPKEFIPESLDSFLKTANFELWMVLPAFLCHYAGGTFVTHSLKDYAWRRLQGLMITAAPPCNNQNNLSEEPDDEETIDESKTDHHEEDDDEEEEDDDDGAAAADNAEEIFCQQLEFYWLHDIREKLKGSDRREIQKELKTVKNAHADTPYSLESIFSGWAIHMLSEGSFIGREMHLNQIRTHVGQICRRIAGAVGDQDITMLEGEGLIEIYHEILMDVKSESYRNNIAKGLREFHHYLVEEFHVSQINYHEVLGLGGRYCTVDANIISFEEYKAILDGIDKDWDSLVKVHETFPEIMKLIVMLSFRCGLRRMEVLKIELDDFHERTPAELIIRPNDLRLLKTKSSCRKLPIHALLAQDELKLLKEFKKKRWAQEKTREYSSALFAIPATDYRFVPERKTFDLIRDIMHKVTGDATLKFQHLRHSFCSWGLLELTLNDLDNGKDVFLQLAGEENFAVLDRRQKLYATHGPSRKYLYAISSLLGHSAPDITLEHYFHFCDLLLKIHLDFRFQQCSRASIIKASGVGRSTTHLWSQSDGGIDYFMARLRTYATKKGRILINRKVFAPIYRQDDSEKIIPPEVETIQKIWTYLYLKSSRNIDKQIMLSRLGLSEMKGNLLEKYADRVRAQEPKNKRGRRNRMQLSLVDPTDSQSLQRLLCPPWPRTKQSRFVFEKFAPIVWKMLTEHKDNMLENLVIFIKKSWFTRNDIVFYGEKEYDLAKSYVKFLLSIGIQKKQLRFISFDNKERSKFRQQWRAQLGLTKREKIHCVPPTNPQSPAVRAWLGIKPAIFPNDEDDGSSGFRTLMVMAAIAADYPKKYLGH